MTGMLRPFVSLLAVATALSMAATEAPVDEVSRLLEAGAEAERRLDPAAALAFYKQAEALRPQDAFVLRKIAQQLSDSLFLEPESDSRRAIVTEALEYARRAADLDPACSVSRLSLAILYGRLASYGSVSEKIEYARLIRRHAEEALALDSDYAWACHVLGRWHLEMASLGTARRAIAAVLFGGLPQASRDEGLRLLERAVALEPDALAHRVELGQAYESLGRRTDARAQWELSLRLPTVAIYDPAARRRAEEGLKRLGAGR